MKLNSPINLGPTEQREITREFMSQLIPCLDAITLYNYHLMDEETAETHPSEEDHSEFLENLDNETRQTMIDNPFVVIGGGAPRDWSLNQPCRDVDIYIYIDTFWVSLMDKQTKAPYNSARNPYMSIKEYLEKKGLTNLSDKSNNRGGDYGSNKVMYVVGAEYKGMTFDLIFMTLRKTVAFFSIDNDNYFSNSPFNLIKQGKMLESIWMTYDVNICQFAYEWQGDKILFSSKAEKGMQDKIIEISFFDNDMKWVSHFQKLVKKFPEFVTRINQFNNF
jgi:hypothetical protein